MPEFPRTPLGLYAPGGGILDDRSASDPARCPVQVATDLGRATRFSQCKNRPKPDKVRPVRNHRSGGTEDRAVCGMHARQYDKDKEDRERWQEERARDHAADLKAKAGAAALKPWGIDASPASSGRVLVDAEQVLAVLQRR